MAFLILHKTFGGGCIVVYLDGETPFRDEWLYKSGSGCLDSSRDTLCCVT